MNGVYKSGSKSVLLGPYRLFYNGYLYARHSTTPGKCTYWRCIDHLKNRCKCRVVTDLKTGKVTRETETHNHPPEIKEEPQSDVDDED